jgi:DNA-binding transcriptional regulator YiaG
MPNIAAVLKAEIARVSRKQSKTEREALKRASTQYRADIAALKRRVAQLERMVTKLAKGAGRARASVPSESSEPEGGHRWRPDGFKKLRAKLELSASDMGRLLGCSGQSVYKWEDGKARPRAKSLPAIAAVRKMGKREAMAKLAELG